MQTADIFDVYDRISKTFDFRNMRGTDLPFNKRIALPEPMDLNTEVNIHSLKSELKSITAEYIRNEGKC